MSCLKLHWPVALSVYPPSIYEWEPAATSEAGGEFGDTEKPVILKFPSMDEAIAGRIGFDTGTESGAEIGDDPLERARVLHLNRRCPDCGRAAVVPVDDQPAVAFRDAMAVPGMGRLIGFECNGCGHYWDV